MINPKALTVAMLANLASIHTVRWVTALAERSHTVKLITLPPRSDERNEYEEGCENLSVLDRVTVNVLPIGAPWGYFLNVLAAQKILKQFQPQLLHVHYASGYGTLARLLGYHPYVLSVWGSDVFAFPDKSSINRKLLEWNLRSADWVCSTSRIMALRTRDISPAIKSLSITPFGVDTKIFQPKDMIGHEETITIGTVKTLKHYYGVDVLIRAFSHVYDILSSLNADIQKKLRLLIVGGGEEYTKLSELVHNLGIDGITEFVGHVAHSRIPEYLRRLDVYCALSRVKESFGVAVLEASACGVPVIVSNMGGLSEVVKDGHTGFIVKSEDVSAAGEAILKLVLESDLRSEMGMKGRQYVTEHYSWDKSVDIMEDIYVQILKKHNSKPLIY